MPIDPALLTRLLTLGAAYRDQCLNGRCYRARLTLHHIDLALDQLLAQREEEVVTSSPSGSPSATTSC